MSDLSFSSVQSPAAQPDASAGLLVQLDMDADRLTGRFAAPDRQWEEFQHLAQAAGVTAAAERRIRVRSANPATLVGSGSLQMLTELVAQHKPGLVILNNDLKPNQERNLERALSCRVLDRTGLILDIFSQRAISHAGRLQVELAQLQHLSTRLLRGWSHLERQRGGIGLRGPGESQLEIDRRLIGRRIQKIRKSLEKLRRQRRLGQNRRQRQRASLVSLVGYTNAGKSTLFNALTGDRVPAANRLFETLDTSMRQCYTGPSEGAPSEGASSGGGAQTVVLSDTVGFISNLPPQIIEAFQATLEGIVDADLLLVVEDCASEQWREQREQVDRILAVIGAAELPRLRLLNKIDLTGAEPGICQRRNQLPTVLAVSARQRSGINLIRRSIAQLLSAKIDRRSPDKDENAVNADAAAGHIAEPGTAGAEQVAGRTLVYPQQSTV